MTEPLNTEFGGAPHDLGLLELPDFTEFMHYQYLPVRLPRREGGSLGEVALPRRLEFLRSTIWKVFADAYYSSQLRDRGHPWLLRDPYIYVTVKRRHATPGNPMNRPGWHTDDFGGHDLNYIWSDVYPTRVLMASGALDIPADDFTSMDAMRGYAEAAEHGDEVDGAAVWIEDVPAGHLMRLDPYVIHDTPIIPDPGGMRSFIKISVSSHRYNLIGNSHNHRLDYDWPMYSREEIRNQPVGGNNDYFDGAPS